MLIVGLVLAQDLRRGAWFQTKGRVQEFSAASADLPFGDHVHVGRLDVAEHSPNPGVSDDCVEDAQCY
jgi:hypothetical protein